MTRRLAALHDSGKPYCCLAGDLCDTPEVRGTFLRYKIEYTSLSFKKVSFFRNINFSIFLLFLNKAAIKIYLFTQQTYHHERILVEKHAFTLWGA
jgi:hypothetical protein